MSKDPHSTSLPLAPSDYVRSTIGGPGAVLKNGYYETDPTNQVENFSIIRRPAFKLALNVGLGPIRAFYTEIGRFSDALFVVSGARLYRVARTSATGFDATQIEGYIEPDQTPKMSSNSAALFITDGHILYLTDGTSELTPVATPDDVAISFLAYVGGYVICVVRDSQRFYWIDPGDSTINALNFAEAEGLPDFISNIQILGDQIYFMGRNTTEVWYLSGDITAPFQRVQGRLFKLGAIGNAATTVYNSDQIAFVGSDGIVRLGPSMTRISNFAIEEKCRKAIDLDAIANIG